MINFSDKRTRKLISSVVIIVIVVAMVGGTILASLAMAM